MKFHEYDPFEANLKFNIAAWPCRILTFEVWYFSLTYSHNLSVFEPIDLRSILPNNYTDQYRSDLWEDILAEDSLTFCINTTWDGQPLGIKYRPAKLKLTSADDGKSLCIHVDAEFFDDKPVPNAAPGSASWELWNHEGNYHCIYV